MLVDIILVTLQATASLSVWIFRCPYLLYSRFLKPLCKLLVKRLSEVREEGQPIMKKGNINKESR